MRFLLFLLVIFVFNILLGQSNLTDFFAESPKMFGEDMQKLIKTIIEQTNKEKNGFLLVLVNDVEPEYIDFCLNLLSKKSLGLVMRMGDVERDRQWFEDAQFKFVLIDPYKDLLTAQETFGMLKNIRTKTAIIFTDRPVTFIFKTTLRMYVSIMSLNVIAAYEENNIAEVFTVNPFYSTKNPFVKLTNTKYKTELFYDKAQHLNGFNINALLTNHDRTKIQRETLADGTVAYSGKDVETIKTIAEHLGGKLTIIDVLDVLGENRTNPWYHTIEMDNRDEAKAELIKQLDITLLIKSEWFRPFDPVCEQIYPHTMNNLMVLVPKAEIVPTYKLFLSLFTVDYLSVHFTTPAVFFVICLLLRKLLGRVLRPRKVLFNIIQVIIINQVHIFPKANVVIQSKLTSVLSMKKYASDINTIDELYHKNYSIFIYQAYAEAIAILYNGTKYENMANRFITLDFDEGYMDDLMYKSKVPFTITVIAENDIARFLRRSKNFFKNGKPLLHIMKDSIMPSFQSFKINYGNVLLPMINKVMRQLSEAGLIDLWTRRTMFEATVTGFLYPEDYGDLGEDQLRALDFKTFKILFNIWLFGITMGSIAFVLEVLIHWFRLLWPKKRIPYLN